MKKTTIDASLLPNVWLTWETTKGKFYLNCKTGKKHSSAPKFATQRYYGPKYALINSGSHPRFAYAKYHKDIERLELAEVTIDTTIKEEVKQWRYSGNKYFLGRDKSVVDENGDVVTSNFVLSQYHYGHNFANFLGMFYRIDYYNRVAEEFKKFLGSNTYLVGSGRVVDVTQAWHIQEWYKTSQKVRGPGKQQKLTDKLTAMQVGDTDGLSEKYPTIKRYEGGYHRNISGLIYFERLEDGWSVLRVFNRPYNSEELYEKERMYLHDDGTNRIVTPSKNGWVPARQNNGWSNYRFANKEEAMQKCNRLKYIIPLIEDEETSRVKGSLMTILRFPELEQMINLGHNETAKRIAHSDTPMADLKYMFGGHYKEKEKTLLRKAGLTKPQLDKYMALLTEQGYYNTNHCHRALVEMRKAFGDDLTHVDVATFNKYCTAFVKMQTGWRCEIYPQLEFMDIDRNKFIKNAIRIGEKHDTVYRVLNDTLDRYRGLNAGTHPEINWYFDDYSAVVRAHDAIDELKRAQDAERRAIWDLAYAERRKKEEEKRKKLDEDRKQYEYEDDDYLIRLPVDSNEIIREGDRQRICIGGYTSSHALGQTNLFFLRKKSDPSTPFYAIEMNNNKVIVQIHGFGNSWLGKCPEAIPTVVRWLRKNGIRCDEKILTCTSSGYGSNNQYVKMPVVD